jgi:hypothetical protein
MSDVEKKNIYYSQEVIEAAFFNVDNMGVELDENSYQKLRGDWRRFLESLRFWAEQELGEPEKLNE